jgi:Secretion system C-terminal sorting domain
MHMKSVLLFAYFCFTVIHIHGQNLADTTSQWNIVSHAWNGSAITYKLKMGNEVTIDSFTYRKVLFTKDSIDEAWLAYENMLIRQDSLKRVYVKEGLGQEMLVYDFGLGVNDTFWGEISSYTCGFIVESIDSVQLNNGELRKRMKVSTEEFTGLLGTETYWIEGIGSSEFGLLSYLHICGTDYGESLLCYYSNSALLYPQNSDLCYIHIVDSDDLTAKLAVKIYPNPLQSHLVIESESPDLTSYSILDLAGRVCKTGTLAGYKTEIAIADLTLGYYTLVLKDKQNVSFSQQLIKLD